MTGNGKPNSKLRRLVRIACSIASLAVLTYITVSLISGRGLGLSRFSGLFSKSEPVETADDYFFDVGRGRTFADLGGALAAAGTQGIQILDAGGAETLRDPYLMSTPAMNAREGRAVAFDIGGFSVRAFDRSGIISSFETDDAIINASINRNGWFCVCTREGGGFKGAVDVYNGSGAEVYRVNMANGYVLSAELSPDNLKLAVLTLTDNGSRVTFFSLDSETADHSYDLYGGLIIDISYRADGTLLAVSTGALIVIDRDGAGRELCGFSGAILSGYAIGSDYIALHLLDYGVGYRGRMIALGLNGDLLGEISTDREIISIAVGADIAVLRNDGLSIFSRNFTEYPVSGAPGSTAGATRVIALGDGSVLAAGDHSAVVIRFE